jgi:hypothetical protein
MSTTIHRKEEYMTAYEQQYARYFRGLSLAMIVIVLVLSTIIVINIRKTINISASIKTQEKMMFAYSSGSKNFPSSERETFLRQQEQELTTLMNDFKRYPVVWAGVIPGEGAALSALKFKEEAYQMKKQMKKQAQENNVVLCDDLGFNQWQNNLPPEKTLSELFQAVAVVQEIGSELIKARVSSLEKITISDPVEIGYMQVNPREKYRERTITLKTKGTSSHILSFLHNVTTSPYLLYVRDMTIQKDMPVEKQGKPMTELTEQDLTAGDPLLDAEFTLVNSYY